MNTVIRLLTELDPEAAAPTTLTEEDEQLLRTILEQPIPQPARKKRPYVRRIVVVTAGVAAIVGIGLTQIDIGGKAVGPSSAAAAVLERAADATLAESDPLVHPGQFLHITLVEDAWEPGYDSNTDSLEYGDLDATEALRMVRERRTRQIWIPYESDHDWTFQERTTLVSTFSRDAARRAKDEAKLTDGTYTRPSWSVRGGDNYIPTYDPDWYASLPRDPEQMLARIRTDIGSGDDTSPSSLFEETYSEVLRSGVAPASVRAALFNQLATMPGMKVVDGVTNLDGTAGVAISFGDKGKQLMFDRKTGRYIGERAADPEFPDVPGLDKAKTTFLTSVTTDVVDNAPKVD
ncbi:hypothetical protein GCM10022234_10420 [Aeromicrobium panaciterrae]|uniref:CU044_5270 family protein n=1 Tax=Aeromicrobium panaciterrae TaxID=363861 RepID=UPI0031D796CE